MKILITGNLGYVGPGVVRRLKETLPAATVVGLDVGYFSSCVTTQNRLLDTYCDQQIYRDIRDVDADFIADFDVLVVLSAISNDPMGQQFEAVTHDINYSAVSRLINRFGKFNNKTIVFASSCSMYGAGGDGIKAESDTLNPLTAYAKSKVAVEKTLENVELGRGTKATSLRFSTACGMSNRLRLDLVLNDFVASAVINREVVVLSDGSPWRPLINTQDMVRAIEWAIIRDGDVGGHYLAVNVGSREWNFTVKDLATAVCDRIPGVSLSLNTEAQPDKRSYRVDFSLFESLAPEHQPQCTLAGTIDELVCGIEPFKDLFGADFRTSRFMRLQMLNQLIKSGELSESLRWRY